jgi:hypothetical protein
MSKSQRARQKDVRQSSAQKEGNGYKPWGLGTLSTFVMGFGGHSVYFFKGLISIGMYKYVRDRDIGERMVHVSC